MICTHTVKHNGVWYHTGMEIKEGFSSNNEEESSFDSYENDKPYKKTEINRMNVESLRRLAKENNVPNAENMTGQDLKTYLITLFEL